MPASEDRYNEHATVTEAIEAIADPINIVIIRFLSTHPNVPFGAIHEAVGAYSRPTINARLTRLKALEIVVGDLDRWARYRLNRSAIERITQLHIEQLLGGAATAANSSEE